MCSSESSRFAPAPGGCSFRFKPSPSLGWCGVEFYCSQRKQASKFWPGRWVPHALPSGANENCTRPGARKQQQWRQWQSSVGGKRGRGTGWMSSGAPLRTLVRRAGLAGDWSPRRSGIFECGFLCATHRIFSLSRCNAARGLFLRSPAAPHTSLHTLRRTRCSRSAPSAACWSSSLLVRRDTAVFLCVASECECV